MTFWADRSWIIYGVRTIRVYELIQDLPYTVLALDRSKFFCNLSLTPIFTYPVHVSIQCCYTFPFTYTYSYAANPDNSISPICVIASCVVPYQKAFAKSIMIKSVCVCPRFTAPSRLLMISCTNCTNWVLQDLWPRKPCWQSASMLSKAKCLLMLLTNICSRVLQQMHVSDTGL